MCWSTRVSGIETTEPASEAFLGALGTDTDSSWRVAASLDGTNVDLYINTGAEVTVISECVWKSLEAPPLTFSDRTIRGPASHMLPTTGMFKAHLKAGNQNVEEQVYVVKYLHRSLLGRPAIETLQLVTVAQVEGVHGRPQYAFPELFEGLGKLEGDYHIKLEDVTTPYALTTPRRVDLPLMKAVKKELLQMEEMGVIARVKEATDWCAGMVVVPKSNGKVRICVDLTNLNTSVCRERHPLSAVDQTLAQLAGAPFSPP